jgi:membrane protein DedA with SNARE-associated domain
LYGGLGYAFGSQWELISDFISDFSGLLVGLLILGAGLYLLFRWHRRSTAETTVVSPLPRQYSETLE